MAKKFKPLSKGDIEGAADKLLAEYQRASGTNLTLPIPVEDLLERHLELTLDFDDLHARLGVPMMGDEPEVLGALWVNSREVFIDQSLDPEEHPYREGRYRFSVGHEIGHWWLHRKYLTSLSVQSSLFEDLLEPTVVCRTSDSQDMLEWQANHFASCIVMPQKLVHQAWIDRFGHARPLQVKQLRPNQQVMRRAEEIIYRHGRSESAAVNEALLESVALPLARRFKASKPAMRIRLEKLGLLVNEAPRQRRLAGVT